MVAPDFRRPRTPQSNYGIYRKLFLGIFAVGAIIFMTHKSNDEDSNLRGSSADEKIIVEAEEQAKEELKDEADASNLYDTLVDVVDEKQEKESTLVKSLEGKLAIEMEKSKEKLKVIMDEYLKGKKDTDEGKIKEIEEEVSARVDLKVRYDLFNATTAIMVEKSNEIDQVVNEDLMHDSIDIPQIEQEVLDLEPTLMADLTSELKDAEQQVESKLDGTVVEIEQEVIKETLGIDVDVKELTTAATPGSGSIKEDEEKNEVEQKNADDKDVVDEKKPESGHEDHDHGEEAKEENEDKKSKEESFDAE